MVEVANGTGDSEASLRKIMKPPLRIYEKM